MTKDDFQDNAKTISAKTTGNKDETGKKEGLSTLIQVRTQPSGPKPPAPKSPFDVPMMPVATKIKLLHPMSKDKNAEAAQSTEEDSQES